MTGIVVNKQPSRGGETRKSPDGHSHRKLSDDGVAATRSRLSAPVLLAFSSDPDVVRMLSGALSNGWLIQHSDPGSSREALINPGVRLVVVDDEAIEESSRGWLLNQIRKLAPNALIVYIASSHSEENERRARSHRVQYYTSRPLDHERTRRVISSFAKTVGQ